jgi:tRNA pseudouridine32 synthase / 23S rRNA pseudouridine746 synthase
MQPAPLEIIHRDAHLAVLNKPADVSLLADRSGVPCLWDTLAEQLQARPYLVHRLDKGTSGVLLIALDAATQSHLTRMFQQRRIRKYYLTWAAGQFPGGGTRRINLPLRKGRKSRYRVAGARADIRADAAGWHLDAPPEPGHASLTRVRLLGRSGERSLLLAAPVTGRTHQLRVHLSWIGHPILGDSLYGRPGAEAQQAPRLQLHCRRLVIPGTGTFSVAPGAGWLPAEPLPPSR